MCFQTRHRFTAGSRKGSIRVECPGVFAEVFVRPKLRRIHKDTDDDETRVPFGRADQLRVPGVQRPHRRHQCHGFPGGFRRGHRSPDFGN